ncbi:MAG: mannose-1-phosphate guanylyltransferase/mannose-6-phosphate isomerase [Pseudomonadota bacterium]
MKNVAQVIPLILSGGSGTRLWPVSRTCKPKQFVPFGSKRSLFQETVLRCRGPVFDARPIVVGSHNHRFLLAEDLASIHSHADVLLEPVARNSCAAIAVGAMQAYARNPDALVLALAADHHLPDAQAFADAVQAASGDARDGYLIAFGIRPDAPATGYGYIAPGGQLDAAFKVESFVEKPDAATAQGYVADGYLWNSGNFLLQAKTFLGELERLQPDVLDAAEHALSGSYADLGFVCLDEASFAKAPAISVDYAVMEKTDRAAVLPVSYVWSDVGSWDSVADLLDQDRNGNSIAGEVDLVNSRNNLVHSEDRLTTLIGLADHIVVSTRDSLLVAHKSEAQNVKQLVQRLNAQGRKEAHEAPQIFRPWGNYEGLDAGPDYQVKRITVKPGASLSLQKHRHRAEHWVVVAGTAEVTVGKRTWRLGANQSTYVPLGTVHRLSNPGSEPLILIEIQTGAYLGEDDIIRLEDGYNRTRSPLHAME